jgi:hypothetical protein
VGALAGINRRLHDRLRLQRLVLDGDVPTGGTPKQPLIFVNPTEPPSASTAAIKGALYFDDDLNSLMQHNGSAWEEVGASLGGSAATVAGTLDVTGAATFGSTVAVTGLFAAPRKVYTTATILTAADSGALCVWSTAAGIIYTLPAAAAGLHFDFVVSVTATSLVHRVVCASGDFLLGTFVQSTDGTYTSALRAADGATHLAWEGNGTTKGGIVGDWLRVTAISGTQWVVYGMGSATGAEATPFVTS